MIYFCHTHAPRFPQFKTLVESIRRTEADADDDQSAIIVVCPEEDADDLVDWTDGPDNYGAPGMINVFTMQEVEQDCADDLPWGRVAEYRTPRDTAWTMQACLPWWIMTRNLNDDQFFYVDDDCFFFRPLQPFIDAIPGEASAGVCRHWYPPGKENLSAGIYNNGMGWWRRTGDSLALARLYGQWAIDVFQPHEQKHLDCWPALMGPLLYEFPRGIDTGPWQLPHITPFGTEIENPDGLVIRVPLEPIGELQRQEIHWLQSYHFHELRRGRGNRIENQVLIKGEPWTFGGYEMHPETRKAVYEPYLAALEKYV